MQRHVRTLLLLLCVGGCVRAGAQSASRTDTRTAATPPSLIVLITIDQFRGDYLDRFGPQLHGGLARLARGGAWFTNAHHDHAITETAPGHATLLSGRFPRSTGIMANRIGVDDAAAPLVGMPGAGGASPRRFQGTTLVDWLRARDSRSRTLSVSMKDRGAILPVGRSRADVYWYYPDGRFTTSRYYRDTLPEWVERFNARRLPQSFAGKSWTPLLPDSAYKEADSVSVEMSGVNFAFPHRIPDDSSLAASLVRVSPWMDEITLDFALHGLRALSLGETPRTDVLAVSLSATDLIGHGYGPDSKEMHDNILRLDHSLGAFLDSLFKLRDSSHVAIVLTGDHGIGTIPELAARSVKPTPVRVDASALAARLRGLVAAANIDSNLVDLDRQIVLADQNALKKRGLGLDSVLAAFALQARTVPGVSRVDRFQDLLRRDTINDPITRRWVHQIPAQSNVELVITLTPFSIFSGIVATHGSPYDYDTHVPLIFYGPWFQGGRHSEFVRTVDLAPTLAEIAGVKPGERIDGVVLRRALK
ncbi:MAG TPA: alkaline phosphatase family protein [Gemmatimonadaceae bacterium]|nr:alkaline phosphatase family protein [Gemmatimonadaceae bacterium]